jgi:TRAP-type mannitol/chloroaromatic compound transport system permease small subunit
MCKTGGNCKQMHDLETLASHIETVNEWIGRIIAWLTVAMVVVTFAVVVMRYAFNAGSIAMQESVTYMHGLVFMLGAAYTLRHDGHVRVDIFYGRFGPKGKAWVDLLGSALLLLPVMIFIVFISWDYVAASWRLLEASPEAGGLPGIFVLKTAIPVMAVLMALQGIALIARSTLVIRGRPEAAPRHDADVEV